MRRKRLSSSERNFQNSHNYQIPNLLFRRSRHLKGLYRGSGICDVEGSVPVMFWKLRHRGDRGRKGRDWKFPKIAHRIFDIKNSWPPVYVYVNTDRYKSNTTVYVACSIFIVVVRKPTLGKHENTKKIAEKNATSQQVGFHRREHALQHQNEYCNCRHFVPPLSLLLINCIRHGSRVWGSPP